MKVFDFTHKDFKKHSPYRNEWLRENYNKPITEEEFVAAMRSFPRPKLHASHKLSTSTLKSKYRRLKDKFGLFDENVEVIK